MAQYYYDKHEIGTRWKYALSSSSQFKMYNGQSLAGFANIQINVWTGVISGSGSMTMTYDGVVVSPHYTAIFVDSGVHDNPSIDTQGYYYTHTGYDPPETNPRGAIFTRQEVFAQEYNAPGDYILTAVAENGTYPTNGIQDGYWWVRGAIVAEEVSGYQMMI